jgi:hypothetical protein
VENAYDYFLAIERGLKSGGDVDDEATDNQRPLISRKGGLRTARRSNDDQVQGDAEGESPSENGHGIAIGGRRHMPPFDRERDLIVENKPDVLKAILDAGTAQGGPVRLPLTITVYPCDATGFVRVVGELESSDLPEDFSAIDDEDGPSHTRPFNEKRAPPPVRPKRPLRKRKPKVRPWGGRHTSIFAK